MKILIADDEKLVRYALKSMLEQIHIPSQAIQVACDGEELMEKVCRMHPDLAFVDIKMPKLNGLEAIDRARALSPHTKWIILTSYSSFEYAKRAIGIGAAEYLLKPVSPEDLSKAITKIRVMNRQNCLRVNSEFEAQLNALFHNTMSIDHDTIDFISSAVFLGALLIFDSDLPEQDLLEKQLSVCNLIRRKLATTIGSSTCAALCTLPEGQLVLVGACQPASGKPEALEALQSLFRRIHAKASSVAADSVRISQLVGEACASYEELHNMLRLLEELAALRVVLGIGTQIPMQALCEREKRRPLFQLCRSLAGLSAAWREKSYLDFLQLVDEIENTWKESNPVDTEISGERVLRFLEVALSFRPSRGLKSDTWIRELRKHSELLLDSKAAVHYGNLVDQAVQFVEKNYMNNIGIAQIAYDLGITPNYLSHLFHKQTGITFVKYITRLRMSKARELLADPANQVQQVARKVGFFSARHFSKMFKQYYGSHPSAL